MPSIPELKQWEVRAGILRERLGSRVHPQHLHEIGHLGQVAESIPSGLVVATEEVYVEDVFPGTSAHGAGLDLAEADIAQSENAEGFEQRAGKVLDFEGNRCLVGASRDAARLPNKEEAGEVALVILDAGLQNLAPIHGCGLAAGDSRA